MNSHRLPSLFSFRLNRGLVLAAFLALGAIPSAYAQSGAYVKNSPKILTAFREVVAGPSKSTVRVQCDKKDVALGTVVGADGWILTKYSQLKANPVCKLKDGKDLEAVLVNFDERHDLALLKIEATGLLPVEWADSKAAPVGNWVACPGLDADPVAIGVVSVAARNVPVGKAPPPPLKAGGGYLGVGLAPDETVARVSQVMPRTGAEKAGVKVNDVILSVNGEEVRDSDSLIAALGRLKPDDIVKLQVKRGEKEMELKATLGKKPSNLNIGDFQNSLGSELSERRTGFPTILHHDSVVKPIDCGGPLVDLDGKVIGINIARVGRTETNAIPAEAVRPVLSKLFPEKVKAPRKAE